MSNKSLKENGPLLGVGLAKLLLHLGTNFFGGYGIFRDEYYYLACGDHLAWGYVDHPPLSIALLKLNTLLFGDSLFAIRLLPALAGALTVILAGLMVRRLGGGRFAQVLAALMTFSAPVLLVFGSIYSMNAFDILLWSLALHRFILLLENDDPRHWHWLGLILGLGLMNKISVLWLGAALVAALLITSHRRRLLTRSAWTAAALATAIFLPHLIWQMQNGFPTLEFMRNAATLKYITTSPWALFKAQVLDMNPLTLVIWLPGWFYFLLAPALRRFRPLALIYGVVFVILALNGTSKPEYLSPLFPLLFACGAVAAERFIHGLSRSWLKPVTLTLILSSGLALAPLVLALLPVKVYIAYSRALGLTPQTSEKKALNALPQFYADMFGWEKMVATLAAAHRALTEQEKGQCAIIVNNYGEAGAVDYYAARYGLPKAICGHNNYWLWGPGQASGEVVIRLGGTLESLKESYARVTQAGQFVDENCMPYENNQPVWICRGRIRPLAADWGEFKSYE